MLLNSSSSFINTSALSPSFDPEALTDRNGDWIQIFGNDSSNLKTDASNLLGANYLSDGKSLKTTLWLASNSDNSSVYNQPSKKYGYGMLIKLASYKINTGFNGADFNYYLEVENGRWSEYLYQLSSTGSQILVYSKTNYTEPFNGPNVGPGYVKLKLNLSAIDNPSGYGLLFYTRESFKNNEVRDFGSWVPVPPATVNVLTSPKFLVIRQGEQQLVPANIYSLFSNNVSNITFNKGISGIESEFNNSGLQVSVQQYQPPIFKINASSSTPVGIYTVPFTATLFLQTTLDLTKSNFSTIKNILLNPEYKVSESYPTTGIITNPNLNLTISVLPPLGVDDQFKNFWTVYGQPISIIMGGFIGGFASLVFSRIHNKGDGNHKEDNSKEIDKKG